MIKIGEKLNSSIPKTGAAMRDWDEEYLAGLITAQTEVGADYLDVNCAAAGNEAENMKKVCRLIRERGGHGIMLDSPDPYVILEAAESLEDSEFFINSVTAGKRLDELAPLAAQTGCGVIVMPSIGGKMPESAEKRLENALIAVERLTKYGVELNKIYIDAMVGAIASAENGAPALTALETIKLIKAENGLKTVCGLSNVSFGLPGRGDVNSAFMAMAIFCGLDAVICDVTSPSVQTAIAASEALCGTDEFCLRYIEYVRNSLY